MRDHGQGPRSAVSPRPTSTSTSTARSGSTTLVELARERKVALPSETPEGLEALVFRPRYANLERVPRGLPLHRRRPPGRGGPRAGRLRAGGGLPGRGRALRRGALRAAAPRAAGLRRVRRSSGRWTGACGARPRPSTPGPRSRRARSRPSPPASSSAPCASSARVLRSASAASSRPCPRRRSARSTRRRASRWRGPPRGCAATRASSWSGIDLAGQEKGYPAEDHREAYQVAHEAFLGKTVHAGEDYGPESIFQAIGDLHADRIGHGTWLFDADQDHEPADRGPQALRRGPRGVRRRQAHHDRGLPDLEPADRARARRRPAASTPSARCAAGGSRPRSAPTTGSSRTPR